MEIKRDERWALLSILILSTVTLTWAMSSTWVIAIPTHDIWRNDYVDWSVGASSAGLGFLAIVLTLPVTALAMIAGRRGHYLPTRSIAAVAFCGGIGLVGMRSAISQAHDFAARGTVLVSDTMWIALWSFVAITACAGRLWRIARARELRSAAALEAVNAEISHALGDIRAPDELIPIV